MEGLKYNRWLLIVSFGLLLYVFPNGFYRTIDRDEPKYLEAAYEMIKANDPITPRFNCSVRYDKPPLTYWLIMAGYKLFGKREFSGRLFVCSFALLSMLLVYFGLRTFINEDVAFWSSLTLVSMLDFALMGSVAMPDTVLTFFIVASLLSFLHRRFLTFSLCSALAVLTKGPVGFALPVLVIVIYLFVSRSHRDYLVSFPWLKATLVFLVVTVPWYVAMLVMHGKEFFYQFFIFHNVKRFLTRVEGHSTQWWYYLANFPWMYFPVSFLIPSALYKGFKDKVVCYFSGWFLTAFLFFQIAHTKLIHYMLPTFPAAAVLVSYFYAHKNWYKRMIIGFLLLLLLVKWIAVPIADKKRVKPIIGSYLHSLKESGKVQNVYFYKYFSAEMVYYSGFCIPKAGIEQLRKELSSHKPVVVVTRTKYLNRFKGLGYVVVKKFKPLLEKQPLVLIADRKLNP
ncbi:glycosyl transferase, family 39 [Thermosulfidibacter takaii ABI70S6]|uniref:Glycosyl transferase, family 39 n=1 Tax=Thermosulfidibacter takaii (strain DSM 17441 / JCM 13301 / NBRC 103674 / ABI70S6) TaxID=1298851 RepID=A0A0S3QSI1_THET7|nr:glycosyltransferase family 39 protein [Thermosulfidibacter takaii]BAT71268.1 glycosyl transferase, family 39 [Thermosulfidibacter takaii ABI70S6]